MDIVSYEKQADENRYMYLMHWDSMSASHFRFHDAHIHRAVELVICEDGKMNYKGVNCRGTITKQEILLFNSFDNHYYEYENDFKGFILVISIDFLNDILISPKYEFNNTISIKDQDWEKVDSLLHDLFLAYEKMSYLEKKANILLLFNCLSKYKLVRNKNSVTFKDVSGQIFQYIEDNYASKMTLTSISKAFGYSTNYFSSLFSSISGKNLSFNTYLNFCRMKKVNEKKEDPRYRDEPIKSIIHSCGFSSSETYYRTVRKYQKYLLEHK